ncbi:MULTISPECIES: deoxyribodipyrimidine photo-lyase [Halorubrum]|uniref:deoxyribodipyrimidine photo-lyase n=1 Tax=Halorubrum TaxID=56688 RepID=UPI0010F96535|nr:deoxyribodipyrimidine photo-lyase [Halorubrum sp. ASP121]
MQLYWHRRTLQPSPNPALSTAFTAAKQNNSCVVPVFVLDDAILSRANGLGVAFMLGSLHELRDWYRGHGGDIVIQHGDPTDVVGRLARTIGVEQVVWNKDHSQLARARDRAVQRALTRTGVAYTSVPNEQPSKMNSSTTLPSNPEAYLANPHTLEIKTQAVPRLSDLREDEYDSAPLTAGTESARKRLRALSNGTTYRRCDDTG